MKFALTGPHQGKSMSLGGFRWKEGMAEIPDEAKDAHKLVRQFYAAHPVHLLEQQKDGKLTLKPEVEPDEVDFKIPLQVAVKELPNDGGVTVLEPGAPKKKNGS